MVWLRIMAGCRPLWQLAILLLYSFHVTLAWQQASIAVAGAVCIAANILFSWDSGHPVWQRVADGVLLVETGCCAAAAALLSAAWPLGPAVLLLLPSVVLLAWTGRWTLWAYAAAMVPWALLGVVVVVQHEAQPVSPADARALPGLLFAMYAALSGFGSFLAFLLQRQRAERRELAATVRVADEQAIELQRLNAQTAEYASQVYELAAAEERNRIAGEIHDSVAHRLTALIVQLQAARRYLGSSGTVDDATANLDICEGLARESLDEVRQSVRRIRRPSDADGLEILNRLVRNFGALTHMQIDLDLDADLPALPARIVTVLYRVLEESLTNARRHGRATRVSVNVVYSAGQVHVQIDDNGMGVSDIQLGFGLSSMRDRLQAIGATCQLSSTPGSGFSLRLAIPLWEGTPA